MFDIELLDLSSRLPINVFQKKLVPTNRDEFKGLMRFWNHWNQMVPKISGVVKAGRYRPKKSAK